MYVTDTATLTELCARLRRSDVVGIDTEFMRERTYYARLCLVQVASRDEVAIIDPLASGMDLAPLDELLADPGVVKVFHAGSQDLEIFHGRTGRVPSPVFDTQVAATLAGHPSQVGYAALVHGVLGVTLVKGEQFTDWSRRPLSARQIEYAEADALHLPAVYDRLKERLVKDGRLEWLASDFARLEDPATYIAVPEEQYRRVKRASALSPRHLGVLMHVAAWREREAQRRDVPRKRVLPDETLVEVARRMPGDTGTLEAVRGISDRVNHRSRVEILEAVRRGAAMSDAELPRFAKRDRHDAPEGVVELMAALVRIRARESGVAGPLLASRDDLEALASGVRDGSPLLEGWRRAIVGDELIELLEGRVSLRVGPRGVVRERAR